MKIQSLYISGDLCGFRKNNQCLHENNSLLEQYTKSNSLSNRISDNSQTKINILFLAEILDLINDAVIITDTEYKVTYWNHKAEKLYCIKTTEIIGEILTVAFEPLWSYSQQQQAYTDALEQYGFWKGENIHLKENGEKIYVESSIFVLEEKFYGLLWIIKDLGNIYYERSLRQIAEYKVKEQSTLIDFTRDAILMLNFDGEIIFCNKEGYRTYGWESSQMHGKNIRQILYDDSSLPQIEFALNKVLENGEWYGELYHLCKNGQKIILEARWILIRDNQGNPQSILTAATDITEKKQLETQFLRTQRLQSIGSLATGIAHDLNNILTPILAVAQLLPLKLPCINENTKGLLNIVLDNCKRGSDLIKQILVFARGAETQYMTLQVGHVLVEVARVIRQTFPKSMEICMDISTRELWMVFADATQLHQVLMNLCLNARDAMANGGTLTLAISNFFIDENHAGIHLDANVGPYVVMTISDTGCGIQTENLGRIFEPFFTTKELGKGTGLGLSTVLSIIKSHGGFVDVCSEVDRGTCFKIYLPAVESIEKVEFSELEPTQGIEELILVVDDEKTILEMTKTSLEAYNYRVLIAKDGIEAITLLSQHEYKIKAVLIDFIMPILDTKITISTLKKINPQVPIIIMSGLASDEVITKTSSSHFQAFLAKPFTTWELLSTLKQVINQSK
ncbi:two-component hybrid sensor and regulator [Richelia intracellularis HM01]|uniref:PAS domain-containing hybrid sensor histidine kinase/response regulator n=1 Tax=Richelia intracellularis TaxID=1164990 RepID=UPI0002B57B4B|nr:PAS domain-containing sensor histidine kinase [Richelia intracellularis]CCH65572.1 two-component hybrid sensor and regulator [Richelia intracellularis HM01]